MITVSVKLFGLISLGTWHVPLPLDLPVQHFQVKLWELNFDISTGPRSAPVPAHSVLAVEVKAAEVSHDPPAPEVNAS